MNPLKINGTYDTYAYLIADEKEFELGQLESNWVEKIHDFLKHVKINQMVDDTQMELIIIGKRYDGSESYRSSHNIYLSSSKSYIKSLLTS